jgi:hypothetical protein
VEEAHRLRGVAEDQKDVRAALKGLHTALHGLELIGRATGELDKHGANVTVNVSVTPSEGITEARELLLLLLDATGLRRLARQLEQRAAELEAPVIEAVNGQNPARPADECLAAKDLEESSI